MEAKFQVCDEPVPAFTGSVTITSMPQNPDPMKNVMCTVQINSSGSASGFGKALGTAARAFVDSVPAQYKREAAIHILAGFIEVQQPEGAVEVKHGGLQS